MEGDLIMECRERVINSVKKKTIDRIPCNFRAEPATLSRIYDHIGHKDYDKLLIDLKIDARFIDALTPPEKNCGKYYQNYWGERYIYKNSEWGKVREDMPGALSKAESLNELQDFAWPTIDMIDYSGLKNQCKKYDDYAILYGNSDIFTRPSLVRGFEIFLSDMIENPEFVHFLAGKFTDFYVEDFTRAQKESDNRIDIFICYTDLASQMGSLFSTAMFDEYMAPCLKRLADRVHELEGLLFFHTCGESYKFFDKLIECGVDIIDPMQRTSERMSPERLKADFGDRISFHGGIDVQTTLPHGTTQEVRAEVRRYISVFRKDAGYICSSAHVMQHDTPPENIIAMYDEIQKQ